METPPKENAEDQEETVEETPKSGGGTSTLLSITEEYEPSIDLRQVNFTEMVQRDLAEADKETKRIVNQTKQNISGLLNCNKPTHVSHAKPSKAMDSLPEAKLVIQESLYQAKEKAKTDIQVIQLYDKSMTNEMQQNINKDFAEKSANIKERTKSDFQSTAENTESMVFDTKSNIENFIGSVSQSSAIDRERGNENPGTELWQKIKNKAQTDFNKSNEKSQEMSIKTIYQIQDNVNELLTLTSAKKSPDDIESEEFVKENIVEISGKIRDDIIRQKMNFSKVVEEARDNVGLNLLFSKNVNEQSDLGANKLRRIYDKTRKDFKQVNDKIHEDVTSVKEQITEIPVDIPDTTTNEEVPDLVNNFSENAQADFQETNEKIQEDVKELKSKITHSMAVPDNSETAVRKKVLGKAFESKMNEFQDMAKSDFQETNENVMDKVEVTKAKIDHSINKLKDTLFSNRGI